MLSAYVRRNAPRPPTRKLPGASVDGAPPRAAPAAARRLALRGSRSRGCPRQDIQAALTVLGRLNCVIHRPAMRRRARFFRLDLRDTALRGADFWLAYLERANFEGADRRGAKLQDAIMEDVRLKGADLRGADVSPEQIASAYESGAGAVLDSLEQKAKTPASGRLMAQADQKG